MACAKDLTILSMAGRYKQPVQYGRESAHKSRAARAPSSLGDYMRDSSHQRGGERAHHRDQGEVSSWRFCPSLNSTQAACFSRSASISTDAGFSPGAGISTPARILLSA
ncbi:MAG: hypothetical protein ACK56F_30690 [bacterium]